jgi:hypothetical protein
VLDGVFHEPLLTEVDVRPEAAIPKELAAWEGDEIVARLVEMGAWISKERSAFALTSIIYRLDGQYGVLLLEDAPKWPLANEVRPLAYARTGKRVLIARGEGRLSTRGFLQQFLGPVHAGALGEYR